MLELLYPNIYCNKIPLPKNPLKTLNSYIVVSPERNLIIDTGFNQPECEEALFSGIAELHLDLTKTDVLLTHRHSDHTGLASHLEEKGARIFVGAKESAAIRELADHPEAWAVRMDELIKLYGLSHYGITSSDHPGYRYRSQGLSDCTLLLEGNQLNYGDYTFSVVDIPGHTPGQIGLYEPKHHLFFCGDHILGSITPNITFWGFEQDSLAQYFSSLRKVDAMVVDKLFTAHREIVDDHKSRIEQLISHHQKRLAEIMDILETGEKNVCQVASFMQWEIKAKNWQEFPKAQKLFAAGEAAAHLEYLYNSGQIKRTTVNGTMYYQLHN
jgi:glyoxylase-like metal-dependent hydrolase (beta-lactamase superfamily II)